MISWSPSAYKGRNRLRVWKGLITIDVLYGWKLILHYVRIIYIHKMNVKFSMYCTVLINLIKYAPCSTQ